MWGKLILAVFQFRAQENCYRNHDLLRSSLLCEMNAKSDTRVQKARKIYGLNRDDLR